MDQPQPPQPLPSSNPNQTPLPKPPGKSRWMLALVALAAVLVIGLILWYFFQKSSSFNQYSVSDISPTMIPTKPVISPTTAVDEIQQVEDIEVGSADAELKSVQQDMGGL